LGVVVSLHCLSNNGGKEHHTFISYVLPKLVMRKLAKVVGSTTPVSHILCPELKRGKLPNVAKREGFLQRGAKCKRSNVDYFQNLAKTILDLRSGSYIKGLKMLMLVLGPSLTSISIRNFHLEPKV